MARLPRHQLHPLPISVTLAIGHDLDRLGHEIPPPAVDGRTITCEMDGRFAIVLWLNAGVTTASWPDIAATIAHEAIHVVDEAFEFVGEGTRTDELRPYFAEHIVHWAMTEVAKRL